MAVLLALAAAGGLFAAFTGRGPARADGPLMVETMEARSTGLTALAVGVSEAGSTIVMAALAAAVGAWCWHRGRRADARSCSRPPPAPSGCSTC
ncbi:hypothetical protein BJF78_00065 [Pseudonocardia sp. CNS-139]|nr:hypothetical protein BJF78_00065 [Pseudonocardia sp. CNS-139]